MECALLYSPKWPTFGLEVMHILTTYLHFTILKRLPSDAFTGARIGSGIVIARLPGGEWSAPSCIGTGGLGIGFQAGAVSTLIRPRQTRQCADLLGSNRRTCQSMLLCSIARKLSRHLQSE